jgi:cation transport ATPase
VQFYVGHQFHSKAWKTLKTRSLGMDFLVSTGTLAAYLYSTFGLVTGILCGVPNMHDVEYFETSAVLITAVLLGKYLEVYAKGQTAAAIHKLSKLKANSARLVRSGTGASSLTPPQSPQAPSSPPGLARTASTDSDAAYNPALSLLGTPPAHTQANPLHAVASVAQENQDEEIDAALLHRRDIVRLVPGETVPADGQLLPGAHIGVDEAMMTVG